MSVKSKLMGVGFAAAQAEQLAGQGVQSITAAGTTSADATLVSSHNNAVSTTAASTGVILSFAFSAGDDVYVFNGGASTLTVYPPTGATIDNTTSASLTTLKGAYFHFATDTKVLSHKST